jgi:hypothetical protein
VVYFSNMNDDSFTHKDVASIDCEPSTGTRGKDMSVNTTETLTSHSIHSGTEYQNASIEHNAT